MGPGRARRERVRAALRVAVEMTGRALASQPALVLLGPTGRFTASLEIQGERSAKRHPVSRGDHRTRYPKRPRLYRFDGSNLSPFDSFFCCRRVAVAASQRKKGIAFQTSDQARLPAEFKHINKRRKRN